MSKSLRIKQLIFKDHEVKFVVQRAEENDLLLYTASQLFCNDELLAQFNHTDIRLIVYFATAEEFMADKAYIKAEKRSRKKSKTRLLKELILETAQ